MSDRKEDFERLMLLAQRQPAATRRALWGVLKQESQAGKKWQVNLSRFWSRFASADELSQLRVHFKDSAISEELERELLAWHSRGISILCLGQSNYPSCLAEIQDPPLILFTQGNLSLLQQELVAIIGARNAEPFSLKFASDLARAVVAQGLVVVSGLATGVDSAAHRATCNTSIGCGATIAVLGSGHFNIYPRTNQKLFEEILACGGLVLSQFEPETAPRRFQFVDRNRVIATLAKAVCLVQAAEGSGSLGTAEFALQAGRDIYVMPGDLRNKNFAGSYQLLKQGATLLTDSRDLVETFSQKKWAASLLESQDQSEKGVREGSKLRLVVESSRFGSIARELLAALGKNPSMLLQDLYSCISDPAGLHVTLIELELAGVITRGSGGRVTLVDY